MQKDRGGVSPNPTPLCIAALFIFSPEVKMIFSNAVIMIGGECMKLEPKDIPGFEDEYYLDPETMLVVNKRTGRSLKPRPDGAGYAEVELWKNNKRVHKRLHRLFAEAYIPNPDNLDYINHKDENPMNYELNNLEWCTQSYNQNYGTANLRRGENISKARKGKPRTWDAGKKARPVIAINGWGEEIRFSSGREAARQLNISQGSITHVLSGQRRTAGGYQFRYADE